MNLTFTRGILRSGLRLLHIIETPPFSRSTSFLATALSHTKAFPIIEATTNDSNNQQHLGGYNMSSATSDTAEETELCTLSGLRKVRPYFFTYLAYAKRRWLNLKFVDVFSREMHPRVPYEFEQNMNLGRITVNGARITSDYVIKDLDALENTIHRHEAAVLDESIDIIYEDDDILVVNKPCSIPVHPCGRYRHNSIAMILKWERGYEGLKGLYRLDRLTSGLLIYCKTLPKSQVMMKQLRDRLISKEYVCLVEGVFPKGDVHCDQSLECISAKSGLYCVGPDGKCASTRFQRIATDGKVSVVKCFPIVNDCLYNSTAFGPSKGKHGDYGKSREQLIADVWEAHSASIYLMDDADSAEDSVGTGEISDFQESAKQSDVSSTSEDEKRTLPLEYDESLLAQITPQFDPYCPVCNQQSRKYRDPNPDELKMYLHCLKYTGPDWEYETAMPQWALDVLEVDQTDLT